jgi:hypothetical protein
MNKVCVVQHRPDLIGLKLAYEVPTHRFRRRSQHLFGLWSGFLIAVFSEVPSTQRYQVKNELRWVILGDNNQSYVVCTLSTGTSGGGNLINYLVISLS